MVDGFFLELLEQRVGIAEPVLDKLGELAVGLLPLVGGEALPEEAVVPQLRAVVEQLVVPGSLGVLDDLQQRGPGKIAFALQQLVGLVHIGR